MIKDTDRNTSSALSPPEQDCHRIWSITPGELQTTSPDTAGFGIRSLAYIIDRIIISFVGLLFITVGLFAVKAGSYIQAGISSLENLSGVLIPAYIATVFIKIAYYTYFHGGTGKTIGKMICGLKVVDIHGETISYRRAFFRWIGYVISSLFFYLGFLWVVVDRRHQGWHDKIVKTYVIKG